ncbi:MAG: serine--tRNA ligase, partial [Tepidanaerobacteraceae bacterium]
MLDIKYLRQNPDKVREALENRGTAADLDKFLNLDEERRNLLFEVEKLKSQRNQVSDEIARKKKAGEA